MTDIYYMQQAFKEARYAFEEGEIPIGAVVVCNDSIVARAHNLTERLKDVTAHAEIMAITSAANYLGGKYLTECTLYVTLEPCVMCAGALSWAQIGRIVFGAADEKRGFSRIGGILHPKTDVIGGIMSGECKELIQSFFAAKR